jgi:hypothetical protein
VSSFNYLRSASFHLLISFSFPASLFCVFVMYFLISSVLHVWVPFMISVRLSFLCPSFVLHASCFLSVLCFSLLAFCHSLYLPFFICFFLAFCLSKSFGLEMLRIATAWTSAGAMLWFALLLECAGSPALWKLGPSWSCKN